MNENAVKIQNVMTTIESLDIKATYENMNKLLGCLQVLASVRDELSNTMEVKIDGNADAE